MNPSKSWLFLSLLGTLGLLAPTIQGQNRKEFGEPLAGEEQQLPVRRLREKIPLGTKVVLRGLTGAQAQHNNQEGVVTHYWYYYGDLPLGQPGSGFTVYAYKNKQDPMPTEKVYAGVYQVLTFVEDPEPYAVGSLVVLKGTHRVGKVVSVLWDRVRVAIIEQDNVMEERDVRIQDLARFHHGMIRTDDPVRGDMSLFRDFPRIGHKFDSGRIVIGYVQFTRKDGIAYTVVEDPKSGLIDVRDIRGVFQPPS